MSWPTGCKARRRKRSISARRAKPRSKLYGIGEQPTDDFGRKCLLARRLVERGVRFVQIYSGTNVGDDWDDAHTDLTGSHNRMAGKTDKPIAGLLHDLKARGLLDSTLVVWGGEFGRTPLSQGQNGRDHHPYGFTMWMAGGGVKGGQTLGAHRRVRRAGRRDAGRRARRQRHHSAPARTRSRSD